MGKILDRFLLFIYSLVILIGSIIGLTVAFAWLPKDGVHKFIEDVYHDPFTAYLAIAILAVLALISLRLLYVSIRRTQVQAPFIAERTELGEFRISLETIENLSLKAATKVRGVKDLKVRVHVSPPGLDIEVRTIVDGERAIPELTDEIQTAVKSQIEEIAGYPVVSVSVYVANTVQSSAAARRVE
ncbi:alkaline shock response membrane anchor protein AmaP [Paenibacillus albiflavus]|uniref:Alkaline shock response membrane anchor protein AmaP n=1 Tax=Paenibacillus albiflavus TaxID=2545760 RepID=A0A4R4EC03_9BACL|nr:alkaline shock response membrane anchor protein AmaP [Paenibacillus albiflavus]TCZ77456.1 alkaline shock response membrane anchor protein AmaP [Paenibacillus albiflavus]